LSKSLYAVRGRLAGAIRKSNLRRSVSVADALSHGEIPIVRKFGTEPVDDHTGKKIECQLCGMNKPGTYIMVPRRNAESMTKIICANVRACLKRGARKEAAEKKRRDDDMASALATLADAITWPEGMEP
jgi:hypothetical protein